MPYALNMERVFRFFRYAAEAALENGVGGLIQCLVPAGSFLVGIAAGIYRRYHQQQEFEQLCQDVAALAQTQFEQACQLAHSVVDEVTQQATNTSRNTSLSPATVDNQSRTTLQLYLSTIPQAVRQSLKRPEDPSGTTLPAELTFDTAEGLVRLLPARLPRFRPGDGVPGKPEWVVERLLGVGGFGEVWLARHKRMHSLCGALKFCLGPSGRELIHEAELVNRILVAGRHPGIVPLLDVHLEGETPWLLYEYVGGGTLVNWMHQLAGQPIEQRLGRVWVALRQVAEALAYMHSLQPPVVHRDLKPANVLWDPTTNCLRITDFGIGAVMARETHSAEVASLMSLWTLWRGAYSPLYASPQQRRGERADPRDDVHAFGVMGYQMVVGRLDVAPGPGAVRQLRKLGVPDKLVELILGCIHEEAEERLSDGSVLMKRLQQLGSLSAKAAASVSLSSAGTGLFPHLTVSPPTKPAEVRKVHPEEDLAEVIASVLSGSTIELTSSVYRLSKPLVIDKPLTLRGPEADTCILESDAEGMVLEFEASGLLVLEGITILHVGRSWADGVVIRDGRVAIRHCRFMGAVCDSTNRRGGSGLWVMGRTVGVVADCDSINNELCGIALSEQVRLELNNNRCQNNKDCGIIYFGSAAGTARDNLCVENEKHGISVGEQAQPDLESNRCQNNKWCGIAFFGSAAGTARSNFCIGNEKHGIYVHELARPNLHNNRCENNRWCGIAFFGSAAGRACDNICIGNSYHGIGVNEQTHPELHNNRCEGNKCNGISYFGSAAGTAHNNTCTSNEKDGIYIGGQAQPDLHNNCCENNKWNGIAYSGSAAGTARNNACIDNEKDGIHIGGQARPNLYNNHCENNRWDSIVYSGLVGGLVQNNSSMAVDMTHTSAAKKL
ncbi:MAG: right-handed parallel beta-helix repeat-containing protein [Thermogemmata sp.]|nr:right-handed parallel beta-helix repeat-containing protein [Thermogemmata sp.]